MKLQRYNLSDDVLTSSSCRSRSCTSFNGRESSESIPYDLIYEVLLRLPVKSIARFRCVSKLWASILTRPDFTELFLTRSSTRPQLLFICERNNDLFFFKAPAQPKNPDKDASLAASNYHMKFPCVDSFEIIGHVRGWVCLTHLRTVKGRKQTVPEICNPSTGQSIFLPKVRTRRVGVRSFFVYDPTGKEFKILSMIQPCYGKTLTCKEHQVLTLGTGKLSWRMIECSIPHHPTCYGICISGCLYYQADGGLHNHYMIVCFDITSEKFTSIRRTTGASSSFKSTLVNYKGKLATLSTDGYHDVCGQSRRIDLWVLVDDEKHEWSKHVYELPTLWRGLVGMDVLCFTGITYTNEIVMSPPRYLPGLFYIFYFNFERGTIRRVAIQGIDGFCYCTINTFLHHVEDVKLFAHV